jgi:hypothetical protein
MEMKAFLTTLGDVIYSPPWELKKGGSSLNLKASHKCIGSTLEDGEANLVHNVEEKKLEAN